MREKREHQRVKRNATSPLTPQSQAQEGKTMLTRLVSLEEDYRYMGKIGFNLCEPTLHHIVEKSKDTLNCPDLDLVRPSIKLAFSHQSSKLTI